MCPECCCEGLGGPCALEFPQSRRQTRGLPPKVEAFLWASRLIPLRLSRVSRPRRLEVWTEHLKKLQDCAPRDQEPYVRKLLEAIDPGGGRMSFLFWPSLALGFGFHLFGVSLVCFSDDGALAWVSFTCVALHLFCFCFEMTRLQVSVS